jgi:hypothetical protein
MNQCHTTASMFGTQFPDEPQFVEVDRTDTAPRRFAANNVSTKFFLGLSPQARRRRRFAADNDGSCPFPKLCRPFATAAEMVPHGRYALSG